MGSLTERNPSLWVHTTPPSSFAALGQDIKVDVAVVGAGIAVGGGAAAWAGTNSGGANREAAKACLSQARADHPDADRAALKEAVKACLAAQGITPGSHRPLTPERQARRSALKACVKSVRADHPDAARAELRTLVKECVKAGS